MELQELLDALDAEIDIRGIIEEDMERENDPLSFAELALERHKSIERTRRLFDIVQSS